MLRKSVPNGFLAGMMVAIGGSVFLSCDNRYVGAAFFSVALLSICMFGFVLYTGKIGFVVENHSKSYIAEIACGLLGNLIGTNVFGLLVSYALPNLHEKALIACERRLMQLPLQTFVRGVFCGVLMYTAVWIFREKKSIIGILFCVPVFILAGFEHSIADMFYLALAKLFTLRAAVFILLVIAGNTLGCMLIPLVQTLKGGCDT